MISYHCNFSKRKQLYIVSNWVYNKFVHFNLEIFPDDPLPIHYSKATGHMSVEFYFYKEKCFGFKHYYSDS